MPAATVTVALEPSPAGPVGSRITPATSPDQQQLHCARRFAPSIQKTIEAIHGKAQNARIVLMGYPPLLSNDASCLNKIPLVGISPEESQWLNGVADYLAQTMFETADLVRKHGVDVGYANPQAFFHGKAVCGDPESIHGIVTDLTDSDEPKIDWPFFQFGISAQSFHPKIAGARLYADTLEAALGSWPKK